MLTLRTLVDEMGLELRRGEEAADAPVRWVHITELPDPTPWLSGGELILTTGLQLTSPKRQRDFARLLAGHHLAGLGFGTGFEHDTVPEALLTAAAEVGLPGVRGPVRAAVHRPHREGLHPAGQRAVRGAPARHRDPQAPGAAGARGARPRRAGARAVRRHRRRGDGARRARGDAGRARLPPAAARARGRAGARRGAIAHGPRRRRRRRGRRLRVRARPPGHRGPLAGAAGVHPRARRAAGLAGGRARRGRARRLRAADPPAGGDRGGARADAPARDARHRAPAGRRRAGRGRRRS